MDTVELVAVRVLRPDVPVCCQTSETDIKQNDAKKAKEGNSEEEGKTHSLLYSVEDPLPWGLCIILGFQHYLVMFVSTIIVPLLVSTAMCVPDADPVRGMLNSTVFFVSGILTILQTSLGVRLPIIQGASFSFLSPTFTILELSKSKCPTQEELAEANLTDTFDYSEVWKPRVRELQGALIIAGLLEMFLSASGLVAVLQRFLGPLTIAPVVTLIGLSLFNTAINVYASKHIGVAFMTIALIIIFSQYMSGIRIPFCCFKRGRGCIKSKRGFPFFQTFSIITAVAIAWILCAILTYTNVFGKLQGEPGYLARTDLRISVMAQTPWFSVPYPGQWGAPTFTVAAAVGMLAGVLSSMLESIGDYHASARVCGVQPPPSHAVSRGLTMEGFGLALYGLWGSGAGTTSYCSNTGVMALTKVANRRMVQMSGVFMIVLACLGKFGALFVTMPDPILGGLFCAIFGMIAAIGISNLQYINMNSSRNQFIFGFSIFMGLSLPAWLSNSSDVIDTGSEVADQIILVLGSTGMFVGGIIGCFLDNTIPGSLEDRGLTRWKIPSKESSQANGSEQTCYDFPPFITRFVQRTKIFQYCPICPTFTKLSLPSLPCRKKEKNQC